MTREDPGAPRSRDEDPATVEAPAGPAEDLPLTVRLAGLRVVVVGAGPVAAGKIASLRPARPAIEVVAPDATEAVRRDADAGRLVWHRRRYVPEDLDRAVLVVAATSETAVNDAVAADAAARGLLCVRADGAGTAALAAAVRRGPLLLTVSTSGRAPALAAALRERLADDYGPEYGALATLLGELRADPGVRARLAGLDTAARRARWRAVLETDILDHIRNGRGDLAREVAISCLSSSSD